MYFLTGIQKYFPEVEDYQEDPVARTVSFKVPTDTVEFDRLDCVSRLLDTKLINFRKRTANIGYCETCSEWVTAIYIDCTGVRFFEIDPPNEQREIIQGPDEDVD